MRLYNSYDEAFVWANAMIGMSISSGLVLFLCVTSVAALFRDQLPVFLNPYAAPKMMLLIQSGAVFLLAFLWVEFRFAKFKQNISVARSFMSGIDTFKFVLDVLFHILCVLSIAFLAYKLRIRGEGS